MIGSEFPPIAAGGGYHIYNLSKKLVERGYKVTVFARGSRKKTYYEEVDGISVYRVRYIPLYPFHLQFHGIFVNRLFKSMESSFDLVHLHNSNIPVIHSSLPTIVTEHGTMQGYVNNYYGIKDVDVVYNGVDTNFFIPAEEKEWKDPYVLYTGRLSPEKGLLDLIESAKYMCQDYPETKFVIIGRGPLERRLRKLVHNLNLNKSISFLGYMNQNTLVKYYQNAMVYVLPSYIEGLSTTLLEAMSCGIPTIATNIAANSEVVVDNETGILVPPGDSKALTDAIIYLLENEDIRESMGKNARKKVEGYSWERIVEETEKVYKVVMNGYYDWR
jgi:glycosyltransferase involved in cell wall biosynthesis